MYRYLGIFAFCLIQFIIPLQAQQILNPNAKVVGVKFINGDSVYLSDIPAVTVQAKRVFKSKADERKFWKLVYNVKKVYPYATIAKEKFAMLDQNYRALPTKAERKEYAKKVEKELMDEFEGELRKLTISQGRILLRLVDRETGNTTYMIVQEFRGSFSAFFWQTVAKLFGENLKSTYDPTQGEDKVIEQIIYQIEEGLL